MCWWTSRSRLRETAAWDYCSGFHEAHLGLTGGDRDRLGIGSIILLALDEGVGILRRDQLHLVPKRFHPRRPIMRSAAGFEEDQAGSLPVMNRVNCCSMSFLRNCTSLVRRTPST